MSKKVLIVGASRGLGLGLVKEYLRLGYDVIATERKDNPKGHLTELALKNKEKLQIEILEMNNFEEIKNLRNKLNGNNLDLLFVNAGVCDDSTKKIGEIDDETFNWVMKTNSLSPMRVIETCGDLVNDNGTIGVMTSGLGSIAANTYGGYEVYRASKAALNMLMKSYSTRARSSLSLIAMMPGWVKTDMGGPSAPLDIETSVKGIAKTIAHYEGKPGLVFVDYEDKTIPW